MLSLSRLQCRTGDSKACTFGFFLDREVCSAERACRKLGGVAPSSKSLRSNRSHQLRSRNITNASAELLAAVGVQHTQVQQQGGCACRSAWPRAVQVTAHRISLDELL